MEIPVTPPSINPLGIKNASNPNDADRIPIRIRRMLFTFLVILFIAVLWFGKCIKKSLKAFNNLSSM